MTEPEVEAFIHELWREHQRQTEAERLRMAEAAWPHPAAISPWAVEAWAAQERLFGRSR